MVCEAACAGGAKGKVAVRNVSKSDVFACLLGRGEQEIILLPGKGGEFIFASIVDKILFGGIDNEG